MSHTLLRMLDQKNLDLLKTTFAPLFGLGQPAQPNTTPTQSHTHPQLPPNMRLVWGAETEARAERITTDDTFVVAYETATTKAALGEWQWQRVALPLTDDALCTIARKFAEADRIVGELTNIRHDASVLESHLLLLRSAMVRLLDDPSTPHKTREAIHGALVESGMSPSEPTSKGDTLAP